ncbi:MAG: T9SS type A sorting domain-containing protein [Ignavibacteria bacterium]|nr:T9SS type A sorting domain-containing protein [Ignavibacteria bacterium]
MFINGVEAYQDGGLSGSPPAWDATEADFHEANNGYEAHNLKSMISNLVEGTNTIAIGVWNNNPGSSDIVFDAILRLSYSTGGGSSTNKFFPLPGNHDWYHLDGLDSYIDYFTLPGNERYYEATIGNVHIFLLSNYGVGVEEYDGEWPRHGNNGEVDGVSSTSIQGQWLQNQLTSCVNNHSHWRIVFGHYSPYKGDKDDPTARWPYKEWGAHILISGHDHFYQVLEVNDFPYIINGVGGSSVTDKASNNDGTEIFYEKDYGACYVEAQETNLFIKFYNDAGELRHTYQIVDLALPVELTFFAATLSGNDVELRWRTETEVNNYGFYIERTKDKSNWLTLGFTEGHGNSNSQKRYNFIDNDINLSGTYYYRLKQIDNDGTYEYSDVVSVEVGVPNNFYLSQNYPNPFNPETRIDFALPEKQLVSLRVFNTLGELVKELVNEQREAGSYSVSFDGSNLPSGVYIYRFQTSSFTANKKMTFLK